MTKSISHIYDKVFKKILTLSSVSVINLINGLFDTNYPTNSTITYHWTEFENDNLKRILADTILTINNTHSYHLEAQMTEDENIIFRVFEYSYGHADRNRIQLSPETDKNISPADYELIFPEPKIIYLYTSGKAPDEYTMKLNFGTQGSFLYTVSTFKFLETSLEELKNRKMIILIPFQLLKLRDLLSKERNEKNLLALQNLIEFDILKSIEENVELGNITPADARKLRQLTHKLYTHIYSHYEELEVLNEMTDESLLLDIEIQEKRHAEELAQKDNEYSTLLAEKDSEYSTLLAEKDKEISSLKEQLAALHHQI